MRIERTIVGHDLDYSEIDELDEIDEDQQLTLIWCAKHRKYEWHWLAHTSED